MRTLNQKLASVIAILWCSLILIGVFGSWQARNSLLSDRRDQLATLVDEAAAIAAHFYTLETQNQMPEADAKRAALDAIAAIRYGQDGYI